MLVEAARESGNPNLRAIIFRQQFTQMTDIVDKTHKLYKAVGATYTETSRSPTKMRAPARKHIVSGNYDRLSVTELNQ